MFVVFIGYGQAVWTGATIFESCHLGQRLFQFSSVLQSKRIDQLFLQNIKNNYIFLLIAFNTEYNLLIFETGNLLQFGKL